VGPILVSATGHALTRGDASRLLGRVVGSQVSAAPDSPHTLRRTVCHERHKSQCLDQSAVDDEVGAGDVAGPVAGEEQHQVGGLLG
jgi:hypothetical protein